MTSNLISKYDLKIIKILSNFITLKKKSNMNTIKTLLIENEKSDNLYLCLRDFKTALNIRESVKKTLVTLREFYIKHFDEIDVYKLIDIFDNQ